MNDDFTVNENDAVVDSGSYCVDCYNKMIIILENNNNPLKLGITVLKLYYLFRIY